MSQYFPKTYKRSGGNIKVKLDLSNYATKDNLKEVTGRHTSTPASKVDLVSWKTKLDNLEVNKLKTFPDDVSNLSNEWTVYDKLLIKLNQVVFH